MRSSHAARIARRTCHVERFGEFDPSGPDSLASLHALRHQVKEPTPTALHSQLAEMGNWNDIDWSRQWQQLAREHGVGIEGLRMEKCNTRGPRVRYDLTTGRLLPYGHTRAIARQINQFADERTAAPTSSTLWLLHQALCSCPFWASRTTIEESDWRPLLDRLTQPAAKRYLSEFPGVLAYALEADATPSLFVNVAALCEAHKKQLVELPLRGVNGSHRATWDMSAKNHLVYQGSKRYLEWYGEEADAAFAARWAHHYHSRVWMPISEVVLHQFDIAAQLVVHPADANALRHWLASAASASPQASHGPRREQICAQVRRIAERALEFISPSLPPAMGETHSCYVVLNSDSRKRVEHLLPLVYFT